MTWRRQADTSPATGTSKISGVQARDGAATNFEVTVNSAPAAMHLNPNLRVIRLGGLGDQVGIGQPRMTPARPDFGLVDHVIHGASPVADATW